MNLDGETNLKERVLASSEINDTHIQRMEGYIHCDTPNESLDFWDGNIHCDLLSKVTNCGIKNLILRGCTLKNTEYCYGICLYTGG